jgi:HEAT repeat protein
MGHEDDGLDETWDRLATLAGDAPPSAAMKARFDATLEGYRVGAGQRRRTRASWSAAAAAIAIIGVAVGRQTAGPHVSDPQIALLRDEIRSLKEMTALALLQQPSPSDRLKGVTWTGQIDQPGHEVVSVLLDTLMRDPNVNVRLSTIDALKRFADREAVRRGALEALKYQSSPLVQIALIDLAAELNGAGASDALRRLSSDPLVNEAVRARASAILKKVG